MTCEILLGDSRELTSTIEGPVHCIITDPPFGMDFQSGQAQTAEGKKFTPKIAGDGDLDTAIADFFLAMIPLVELTAEDTDMYVFTSWREIGPWMQAVNELSPFEVENVLIWDKDTMGMGDLEGNWGYSHELIIYAKKGHRPLRKRMSNIIHVPMVRPGKNIHPTQKPTELMERLLEQSTEKGDLVVDPFSGSGATIVAAQRLGRRGIGIELDPDHHARSSARLAQPVFDI